ncbi:extracellular protein [Cordyceps javanica]|uniref:Extracellular protein n=1 Tax=Cordyceps javanica TaxID=43265 RepID=A0A545VJK5_9HYPO|nr:extracellular protein [Cordyceps javanica]TQW01885.1 extracellular protein [Cordyceps javanica]
MKIRVFPTIYLLLGVLGVSHGHMQMSWPPALRSEFNPHTTDIDYDMTAPLHPDGSDFPCKGYHSLLNTQQGGSVVSWEPGQTYNFTLAGTATHGGGSCQASLSFDEGRTWKVLHSYIGNCPLSPTWEFVLPGDTPAGSALFAWSWFNKFGNQEMYMNCAHVTIDGGNSSTTTVEETYMKQRPVLLAANVGNGCGTVEGFDLAFPHPGPAISSASENTAGPVGHCSAD